MIVTDHALMRWRERVDPSATRDDIVRIVRNGLGAGRARVDMTLSHRGSGAFDLPVRRDISAKIVIDDRTFRWIVCTVVNSSHSAGLGSEVRQDDVSIDL